MKISKTTLAALLVASTAPMAHANDSWGALTPSGLYFSRTDAVVMEKEDLYISPDRITVDYVFRNITATDAKGEIIFPLPPINLGNYYHSPSALDFEHDPANPVQFTASVDDAPMTVTLDMQALMIPDDASENIGADQMAYTPPGEDITEYLRGHGIPVNYDLTAITAALLALSPEVRADFAARDLAYFDEDSGSGVYPNWSVAMRYHWTQTFPAETSVKVGHGYETLAGGGFFSWDNTDVSDYQKELTETYCVDDATARGFSKIASGEMSRYHEISYILRSANSWAGPIKDFKLTIDKGAAANIISLCADGVVKTGPTTFEIVKKNYSPERDIDILIAVPN